MNLITYMMRLINEPLYQDNQFYRKKGRVLLSMNHIKWQRTACNGCKHHNPECKRGACDLFPYVIKKVHTQTAKELDSS